MVLPPFDVDGVLREGQVPLVTGVDEGPALDYVAQDCFDDGEAPEGAEESAEEAATGRGCFCIY